LSKVTFVKTDNLKSFIKC